ncbi:hypothetical protein SLEP1_g38005 [Rubroshorea leprosula]|uniref:Uncharacterized protein n=1 Tax=Rubroshorea leprosula TaxID=152421 RepID=A0AAV5KWW4_9ROSI|nr:hypothetical protein SLEP1_g38005 [Rubroshorea leprosula]
MRTHGFSKRGEEKEDEGRKGKEEEKERRRREKKEEDSFDLRFLQMIKMRMEVRRKMDLVRMETGGKEEDGSSEDGD